MFGLSYEHNDCNYCNGNCYDRCGQCASFTCYGKDTKGICSEYSGYECYPDDNKCSSFRKSSSRYPSNCYITTAICRILGYGDDCQVLATLRSFRNDVMANNVQYKEMLETYDEVGPKIAAAIYQQFNEEKDTSMWDTLYNLYLVQSFNLLNHQEPNLAINKYTEMVKILEDYYAIHKEDKQTLAQERSNGPVKMKKLGSYFEVLKKYKL